MVNDKGSLKTVDEWNAAHKTEIPVQVLRDDGTIKETKTRSIAWLMRGRTAMIKVDGIKGPCLLSRVTPITPDKKPEPPRQEQNLITNNKIEEIIQISGELSPRLLSRLYKEALKVAPFDLPARPESKNPTDKEKKDYILETAFELTDIHLTTFWHNTLLTQAANLIDKLLGRFL